MLACGQGPRDELIMALRGRGHDDDINIGVSEEISSGPVDGGLGVILSSFVARPLDDGLKLETGAGEDVWDLEDLGREAVADDAHAVDFGGHFGGL